MKPRVLFLDHTAALGGAEFFLLELARHIDRERLVILFSDGPFRALLQKWSVPVDVMQAGPAVTGVGRGGRGVAQLLALPWVFNLAHRVAKRAKVFDVLFANSLKALVVGAVAAMLSGKPLVWYLHDIITAEHFSGMNRRICVVLANRFAARVIANSAASMEAFIAAGGKRKRVNVVYNGLNAALFQCRDAGVAAELRRGLGIHQSPVVAVFSRLAPWKGQHVLLDALALLPGVHGLLIGAPLFGEDEQYEQQLRTQAARLGLSDRVHFLGFQEDIPRWLQVADVVAHTSVAPEPFGRVIVEGMLAGKPVVATRAGGACEIIEDGVTGRLVTPGNSSELANVLKDLLADSIQTAKVAQAGCVAAGQRFSVDTMVAGIEQTIDEAIRGMNY
jgi:glycosyltransferase involved in cell wall biosynthesis